MRADAKSFSFIDSEIRRRKLSFLKMDVSHLTINDAALPVEICLKRFASIPVENLVFMIRNLHCLEPRDSESGRRPDIGDNLSVILPNAVISKNTVNSLPLVELSFPRVCENIHIGRCSGHIQHK